jgi:hypothetical protein
VKHRQYVPCPACPPAARPPARRLQANTDEGYTRTREEYACQMRLLIDTWRAAWGYQVPFFWMQLHPWGSGGGAADERVPLLPLYGVRLAQEDVARLDLGMTAMASAIDGCEHDAPADGHDSNRTCNLHPGYAVVAPLRRCQQLCSARRQR